MESTPVRPIRSSINTREIAKKEAQDRKKNLLYLILNCLKTYNLYDSAEMLEQEAQLTNQYDLCDNIDLDIILQEYQSYYIAKFKKLPKIIRKNNNEPQMPVKKCQSKTKPKTTKPVQKTETPPEQDELFQFEIVSLTDNTSNENMDRNESSATERIRNKPLCEFERYTTDWKEMAEQIVKEIISKNLGITWDDCIGLKACIESLKEAVIYPLNYPEIFNGLITPWKGILLYGPPGTGKTLLAKALASECSSTFINVTSSSFISKWRGESEKLIKVLFDVAKYYAPTTIFVDELDAITSGQDENQHEASRRFKSELLIQLDGLLRTEDQVFILATTNSPWKLDPALLRRFEKRILVDLPNEESRINLFKYYLNKNQHEFLNHELKHMAEITVNCSGSDIKLICKEIAMNIVRERMPELFHKKNEYNKIKLRKACLNDGIKAVEKIKPSINSEYLKKYHDWHQKFGCM